MNSQLAQDDSRVELAALPGDVLLSHEALPYPGAILSGFRRQRYGPQFDPFLNFKEIQNLLEFLEHVVLCERLIIPIPRYSRKTEKLIYGKKTWIDFAVFRATGDLDYTTERLTERLESAGVLTHAEIHVGESSADDVVAALLPRSKWMQGRFTHYLDTEPLGEYKDKFSAVQAQMAKHIGAPIHTAQAATLACVPFILGARESQQIAGFERESLRVRKSVTQLLLDRLNGGARTEIERLAELGPISMFPETPIARMIVREANSPDGLVEAALELRNEFSIFRHAMNQIEADLSQDSIPLSVKLKRLVELERLAKYLWKESKTDLRTSALSVSESLAAIPEVLATPSPSSIGSLANKLLSLPVEKLVEVYRRRKVRLLLKAKRSFLSGSDSTAKLASIFGVSEDIARRSRMLGAPTLSKRYAAANPDFAALYYDNNSPLQAGTDDVAK